jgi:hypothetical protein
VLSLLPLDLPELPPEQALQVVLLAHTRDAEALEACARNHASLRTYIREIRR